MQELTEKSPEVPDDINVEHEVIERIAQECALGRVWEEIRLLPLNQRRALLWHLSQEEIVALVQGAAHSLESIAHALEMEWEEFCGVYGNLPMSDQEIARRLALNGKQKVINLRKCARERMQRRLSKAEW